MIKDLFKRETFYVLNSKAVLLFAVLLTTSVTSCSLNKRMEKQLSRTFKSSKLIEKYHTGFALYDMENGVMVFQRQADKYFTPASNTKLFTFYAGLKLLPDSIPSLRYITRGDSLIFWGTGDPSFLQSKLKGQKAAEFLKYNAKKLFFAPGRYTGNWYGRGWQWDDYNDYYQAEITELPMMDNLLAIKAAQGRLQVSPALFKDCLVQDSTSSKKEFSITRDFRSNIFRFPKLAVPINYRQEIPYQTNLASTLAILSDTIGREIQSIDLKMPAEAKTIYNMRTDSVFKAMLLPSDNFIAEQLLLVCANQLGTDLNTDQAIAYVVKNHLSELPDAPKWVDGSGLSRGNLFTPRDMVKVLELIYKTVNNPQRLYDMLPAGGNRGTLKNAYPKTAEPFVFGKTGTLSNNHNQSGYVLTKKGKTYIYAFMNNNFIVPVADVRKEMARIVTYIHENF